MLNIGKRHMACPELSLTPVEVMTIGGWPAMYPVTTSEQIVISGIVYPYEGGYEVLTGCKDLDELRADYAWYRYWHERHDTIIRWYVGVKEACEAIVESQPVDI